jgi:predicted aspartyl protease
LITGVFRDKHPRVVMMLQGRHGAISIEFMIDTAFDGGLKVPPDLANDLDLTYQGHEVHKLANGDEGDYPVYAGNIEWADGPREVDVLIMDGEPLIGTGLLLGVSLYIEGQEGAELVIQELD